MGQDVRVSRRLSFIGDAAQESNIRGNIAPEKIFVSYDYRELALDDTNKYTPYLDTTSAIALASGGITLTTAATDTKVCSQTQGGIWWYPAKNPVVEMTFQIDVITNVAIFAGFSDAVSEASSLLPHAIATATQTATATDSAGLLFDTLQSLSYFNIVNSLAAGSAKAFTQLASTFVPVAAKDITIRVSIDSLGNISYTWNGRPCGYKATGVTTTTPLIPYFGIRNNSGTAHIATLKRVRLWSDI